MGAQERGVARRREVLAAARSLLLSEGELTISALSARSGASVGSLYHHFGSKEGVLAATAETLLARYRTSLQNELRALPSRLKPTVKAIVLHHARFLREEADAARLLAVLQVDPSALLAEAAGKLQALVHEAASTGVVDPVPEELLAALLLGPIARSPRLDDESVDFFARAAWRSLTRKARVRPQ